MNDLFFDTICAVATPSFTSAIGIIRVSGCDALSICKKVFASKKELKDRVNIYGKFVDDKNVAFDDGLVCYYKAPNSYTGEDLVELFLHGNVIILDFMMKLLIKNGARVALPGEFTKRAYLNNKLDLVEAEAVMSLISAKSVKEASLALNVSSGLLSKKLFEIKEDLVYMIAEIQSYIDYADEFDDRDVILLLKQKLPKLLDLLAKIIENTDKSEIYKGVKTAIVGRANAGKSSLMNKLTFNETSIVTEFEGTTRDVIEKEINVKNIPLLLLDTAGLRKTEDPIEKIGQERTMEAIKKASLVLYVVDINKNIDDEEIKIIKNIDKDKKKILILNKVDLDKKANIDAIKDDFDKIVEVSLKNDDISLIEDMIESLFSQNLIETDDLYAINERQKGALIEVNELLKQAYNDLLNDVTLDAVTVLAEEALEKILSLTGEKVIKTVTDEIFSKFCVGK